MKLNLKNLQQVKDSPVHPTLGRRGMVVPSDIPRVAGIESAEREMARWPVWKRRILFHAFGVTVVDGQ